MSNLFDDFELTPIHSPQPVPAPKLPANEPPKVKDPVLRIIGCLAIVGSALFILIATAAVIGIVTVRNQTMQKQEAARVQAEEREAKRRLANQKYEKEMAARAEANAAAAKSQLEQHAKEMAERDKMAKLQQEEFERIQQAQQQHQKRLRDEVIIRQTIQALAGIYSRFSMESRDSYVLPHGGEEGSGLSWRVHLLPYIGQNGLHSRFKLDEPWDSEYNKTLIKDIPEIFGTSEDGKTRIRSLLNVDGKGWPYVRTLDVIDGLDETLAVYVVGSENAIEWTKPDDLENATDDELSKLLTVTDSSAENQSELPGTFPVVPTFRGAMMCDSRIYELDPGCTAAQFRTLVTHNRQEVINIWTSGPGSRDVVHKLRVDSVYEPPTSPANDLAGEKEILQAKAKILAIGKAFQAFRKAATDDPSLLQKTSQLSWRVQLLPYLGFKELHDKFQLDQPWNSPANFELITQMPEIFQLGSGTGRTRFCIPTPDGNSDFSLPALVSQITDDADTNTLLYYGGPSKSTYWTKPSDGTLNAHQFESQLGWGTSDSIVAGTPSGKCLLLPPKLHRSKIAALISRKGNENFDLAAVFSAPEVPLRQTPVVKPASRIEGTLTLPKVPPVKLTAKAVDNTDRNDVERLRKIALAIHNFEDSFRQSPLLLTTPQGQPSQLSWRVHLLPFLDQKLLYEQFALDEPWNSPKNKAAAATMPEVYGNSGAAKGRTDICALVGEGMLLSSKRWMNECEDGINNTIMLVQTGDSRRVPWTKPEDIEVSESFRIASLGTKKPFVLVAMGDGAIMPLPTKLPEPVFSALASARGKELVDAATVRRLAFHAIGQPVVQAQLKFKSEEQRLKTLALASLNYESVYRIFPPGRRSSSPDLPVECFCLSWRVHILPLLGYSNLYRQFRMNEPWDSDHNKQLIPYMPDVYRDEEDPADTFKTRMQVVVGAGSPFPETGVAPTTHSITDGMASTLQILIAPPKRAVTWTQPLDYEVDMEKTEFKDLRGTDGVVFTTFDGAIYRMPPTFETKLLKSLITVSGGEVIDTTQLRLP